MVAPAAGKQDRVCDGDREVRGIEGKDKAVRQAANYAMNRAEMVEMLNGLALEIATSVKSGKSRFEIRLDPADLGRIDVRIDVDRNGKVTSHLTVEKPETLSIGL